MKKKYEFPALDILYIEYKDILTVSVDGDIVEDEDGTDIGDYFG